MPLRVFAGITILQVLTELEGNYSTWTKYDAQVDAAIPAQFDHCDVSVDFINGKIILFNADTQTARIYDIATKTLGATFDAQYYLDNVATKKSVRSKYTLALDAATKNIKVIKAGAAITILAATHGLTSSVFDFSISSNGQWIVLGGADVANYQWVFLKGS